MNIVTDVVLPIALAFIMFSLGLGLSLSDFTRIFTKPKEFFIGLKLKEKVCFIQRVWIKPGIHGKQVVVTG